MPSRIISGMRTIPNSNLIERKRNVLDIHRENLRFVKRLADLNAQQGILNREVSPENVFWFRSRSQHSRRRSRSNSLIKQMASNLDDKTGPKSKEAKSSVRNVKKLQKPNQTKSS